MRGLPESPLRVLVVDDNTDTAESLAFLLQMSGHDTRVAHTGTDAIAEAKNFHPTAVLLDVGLPDMSGYEVAQRLRAHLEFRHTILIAATGYNRDSDRARAFEVGFDHYLVKPFDPNCLDKLIQPRTVPLAIPA
jgi:two-component system CheB/CheR fusion protein